MRHGALRPARHRAPDPVGRVRSGRAAEPVSAVSNAGASGALGAVFLWGDPAPYVEPARFLGRRLD
jgi:hypothetical protein